MRFHVETRNDERDMMKPPTEPGFYWILYNLEVIPKPRVAEWTGSHFITTIPGIPFVPASEVSWWDGPLPVPMIPVPAQG